MAYICYDTHTVYGCVINAYKGTHFIEFVSMVEKFNEKLADTPFKIHTILQSFDSHMEGMDSSETRDFDKDAAFILGFVPHDDLTKTVALAEQLKECITAKNVSDTFDVSKYVGFYGGIDWKINLDNWNGYDSDEEDEDEDEDEEVAQ